MKIQASTARSGGAGIRVRSVRQSSTKANRYAPSASGFVTEAWKNLRSVERLETIPDAEDGLDVLVGIHTQFLAQPANVNIQRSGTNFGAVAPHTHQQCLSRDDLPGMLDEQRQQIVLLTGQGHTFAVQGGQLLVEV